MQLAYSPTVPDNFVVGVTRDNKPFILVLTAVRPYMHSLVTSTKTKEGLIAESDPLPF